MGVGREPCQDCQGLSTHHSLKYKPWDGIKRDGMEWIGLTKKTHTSITISSIHAHCCPHGTVLQTVGLL